MKFLTSLFTSLFVICNTLNAQTVLYVNHAAAPSGSGLTWITAFDNLQDAIDISNSNLAVDYQIWVAAGTYLPTLIFDADGSGGINPKEATFYINKDVAIYGGFDGTEILLSERNRKLNANPTILSGNLGASNSSEDCYHVLFIDGTTANGNITNACILDGFQITRGRATGSFQNNKGGGIYNNGEGAGNECSPSILNCKFNYNTSYGGGGVYNNGKDGASSPKITNCSFTRNDDYSDSKGEAIYNNGENGVSGPVITNCSFFYNFGSGGVIRNDYTTNVKIENCIVWGDNFTQNIVDQVTENGNNGTTINYSIIDDGNIDGTVTLPPNVTGTNNFDSDPLLFYSLRLQANSPAINAGNTSAIGLVGIASDLGGNNRIFDGTVDIGAYEIFCPSGRIYVDINAPVGGDGLTWGTAFTDLQDGIDWVYNCASYREVWVATGTYLPTVEFDADGSGGSNVREKTFYINRNIKIYGGFAGTETMLSERDQLAHPTILSGDIDNTPDNLNNAYHVLIIDATTYGRITNYTLIDGFQIKDGNANGSSSNNRGGGIYNKSNASTECSPSIFNCSFSNNNASLGGAIYNRGSNIASSPIMTNCSFFDNNASSGGAIYNFGSNSAGINNPQITNCSFSKNTASNDGGAVYNFGTSNTRIENCILWNNDSPSGEDEIADNGSNTTLNYSIISVLPPNITGADNLYLDPLFVNAPNGDLRLQSNSPAVNSGNNLAVNLAGVNADQDGNERIINCAIDRGAYENTNPTSSLYTSTIFVDINAVGNNTGSNWADAFTDLQDAIDLVKDCDTLAIWVAAGTYFPTVKFPGENDERDKTFYIDKDMEIYGGFDGTETMLSERNWVVNPTVLNGDIGTTNDNTGVIGFCPPWKGKKRRGE